MERQSHTEVVKAPIGTCFEAIVDFEQYPDWFTGISRAIVEKKDEAKGLWTVTYELQIVIKTISYTLDYRSERPHTLTWTRARGDVKNIEGDYRFTELEAGLTEAECTQGVDIGFWIPGPLRRIFERTALIDSVREFKKAAERRAA